MTAQTQADDMQPHTRRAADNKAGDSTTHNIHEGVERMGGAAKAQAAAVWDDAAKSAQSMVNREQQAAASRIGGLAGALETAAQQLERQDQSTGASTLRSAAEACERVAAKLREKDSREIVYEVEQFARNQPGIFFGAAVAAGFFAMRFLKSNRDDTAAPSLTGSERAANAQYPLTSA